RASSPTFSFSRFTILSASISFLALLLLGRGSGFRRGPGALLGRRGRLPCLADLARSRRAPDDQVAPVGARHRPADDQKVVLLVQPDDLEVLDGHAGRAEVPRAAHPRKSPRGKRRSSHRARGPMEHRTMRGGAAPEMMALHDAREPLALAD